MMKKCNRLLGAAAMVLCAGVSWAGYREVPATTAAPSSAPPPAPAAAAAAPAANAAPRPAPQVAPAPATAAPRPAPQVAQVAPRPAPAPVQEEALPAWSSGGETAPGAVAPAAPAAPPVPPPDVKAKCAPGKAARGAGAKSGCGSAAVVAGKDKVLPPSPPQPPQPPSAAAAAVPAPPPPPAASVEQAAVEQAAGGEPPAPAAAETPVWVAKACATCTLSRALREWAEKDGWTLMWKPNFDYPIAAPLRFSGSFRAALESLMKAYEGAERPLVADVYTGEGQKVVVVAPRGESR